MVNTTANETKTFGELKVNPAPGKGARVKRFIVSTDSVDRDGDVVVPAGMEYGEYMANPVFLWAHQFHLPPVGKCVDIGATEHLLWADVEFAKDEFADRIFKLYDGGFMNAVSIGFKTLREGPPDSSIYLRHPDAMRTAKRVIYRAKLLEISAVPIPSNADALQIAVTKGLISPDFVYRLMTPESLAADVLRTIAERYVAEQVVDRLSQPAAVGDLAAAVMAGVVEAARRKGVRL